MKNEFLHVQQAELNNYKLDLTNLRNITIYNNISQIGFCIKINYMDVTDIKNKMPIKGGEEFKLTLIDKYENKFKKTLVVSNVIEVSNTNEQSTIIQLEFITKEAFYLSIKRDYSYYENNTLDIIKNYLPDIDSNTKTTEVNNIVIPGFTYNKAIQYITQRTQNYVFEGTNNFIHSSLEDLLIATTSDTKIFKFNSNNPINKELIIDYSEVQVFNSLDEGYNNAYNKTNTVYNPETKTISTKNIKIKELQTNSKTLGSGENYSTDIQDNINTKYRVLPSYPNAVEYSDCDSLFNKHYDILVYGDLSLEIGEMVNIKYKDRFNANPNPLLNGLYMITKIAHHIDTVEFLSKLRISKNAYFKDVNNTGINDNVVL